MAISANTVWEVEIGGSITNGGGFVTGASGTDWSKQTGPQYSVTDGVTAGTTTITSATAAFGTDVVGNLIYVQGGTGSVVAGWYQITVRNSATSITVDRSTGLTAGTGVTLHIGGAFPSIGQCGAAGLTTGHIIFVKQATYSMSTASTNVDGGFLSDSNSYMVCGYSTNRNLFNTDTRPLLQWGASTLSGFSSRSTFVNLDLDGNAQTACKGYSGTDNYQRCMFRNMNTTSTSASTFIDCLATTNSAVVFGTGAQCDNCEAYANTATPYGCLRGDDCLSYGNTGATTDGFQFNANNSVYKNCDSYGNGRSGFRWQNATRPASAINCHSEGNAAYGYDTASGSETAANILINCSHYNNTSGGVNSTSNIYNAGTIAVTAGSVYTNAAGNDFSKNNTASRGALLRATADPATFPRGVTPNYRDIGAAQHADPASGGGFVPSEMFGIEGVQVGA